MTPRNEKITALLKRQDDISNICVPLLQCKLSVVVYYPIAQLCHCVQMGSSRIEILHLVQIEIFDSRSAGASNNYVSKELLWMGTAGQMIK